MTTTGPRPVDGVIPRTDSDEREVMRRFLIDGSSTALAVALLASLVSFARSQSATPAETPEALEISRHAVACPACRLPLYGSAGKSSMLGPGPSRAWSAYRGRGPAEEVRSPG